MFFKHVIPPFAKISIFLICGWDNYISLSAKCYENLRHALERVVFFSNTELMFLIGFVKFKAINCLSEAYLLLFG